MMWRDVLGFEGIYRVSDSGMILRVSTIIAIIVFCFSMFLLTFAAAAQSANVLRYCAEIGDKLELTEEILVESQKRIDNLIDKTASQKLVLFEKDTQLAASAGLYENEVKLHQITKDSQKSFKRRLFWANVRTVIVGVGAVGIIYLTTKNE